MPSGCGRKSKWNGRYSFLGESCTTYATHSSWYWVIRTSCGAVLAKQRLTRNPRIVTALLAGSMSALAITASDYSTRYNERHRADQETPGSTCGDKMPNRVPGRYRYRGPHQRARAARMKLALRNAEAKARPSFTTLTRVVILVAL
jgi:hypothetical protein